MIASTEISSIGPSQQNSQHVRSCHRYRGPLVLVRQFVGGGLQGNVTDEKPKDAKYQLPTKFMTCVGVVRLFVLSIFLQE